MSLKRDEHTQICAVMAETLAHGNRHTFMGTADELIDALETEGWAIVPVARIKAYDQAVARGKELAHRVRELIEELRVVTG